jgi:hypothetical protein
MAALYVPERYRLALIQLAKLSDDAVDELCGALESNPDSLTARDKAHEVAAKVTKLLPDIAVSIFDAVIPLLFVKATGAQSTSAVVNQVAKALKTRGKPEETLPANLVPSLEKNLGRFLDLSGIALRTKALSLATDTPRLFTEAKIISDMRPVFGGEVSNSPIGASVVHNFRITFSEDEEEKQFFVLLDMKDLRALQELIARAITKDQSLKSFLKGAKLKIFETSPES